jgi:hypothetical protein
MNFEESELTSEKSLWDVYWLSRTIKPSKFQFFAVVIVMLALAINAFVLEADITIILADTRKWASSGFNFSITTLGFLIAGFTIFATLSKPEMMLAMMSHRNKKTNLPTLKYNFFTFMKIFIMYIVFSVLYLAVELFGQKGGLLSNLIALMPNGTCLKVSLIKVVYIIVGSSFFYLLLLLKTFIFNIYTITMNFLRWEYRELKKQDRKGTTGSG